jgi:cell division protein FtsQ
MFKQVNWILVLRGFTWILCLCGLVVLMSFVMVKKQTVKCTDVKIFIPGADNFIEREEIDVILKHSQGKLIGRNLDHINLHDIEDQMKANPYIALAKVYADMDGVINIEVKQRQPLLRIINANNQDFYVDKDGLKMPVSPNFTANVIVANGSIFEGFNGKVDTLKTQLAADLYKTASFIKKDTLWDAQIEQLFVNDDHDIVLIPRVGNQRIILGNADSLEIKMENLFTFYKKAMPKVGWETYKTINIKYTNQIICEKSKLDSLNTLKRNQEISDSVRLAKKSADEAIKKAIKQGLDEDHGPQVEQLKEEKKTYNKVNRTTKIINPSKSDQIKLMPDKKNARIKDKTIVKPVQKVLVAKNMIKVKTDTKKNK